MIAAALIEAANPPESAFSAAVRLITGLAWPCVVIVLLATQKDLLSRLLKALAVLAESADKVKIWQFELQRSIDAEVRKVAEGPTEETLQLSAAADIDPAAADLPQGSGANIALADLKAASRVETLVKSANNIAAEENILGTLRSRLKSLAKQYDLTRSAMVPRRARTKELSGITSQMRALGIAAKPLLREFVDDGQSAGLRLCAVSILQMAPDRDYLDWLRERFGREQPFVLFQSAVALIEAIRLYSDTDRKQLSQIVSYATEQTSDADTLRVLSQARGFLEHPNHGAPETP